VLFDIGSWRVSDVETLHAVLAGRSCPRPHVMVLSERDQLADRIDALNAGADDYLVKPFAFEEVMARLHALARRAERAL
jgi:DNA-binding response OmpR family regulator